MEATKKLTAIADAIRAKTGSGDGLTLDDMAAAIPAVYDTGKATSKLRYYVERITLPARQTYIDLPIDFYPHVVQVYCLTGAARSVADTQVGLDLFFLPGTAENYAGMTSHNLGGTRQSNYFGITSGAVFRMLTENEQGYRLSSATVSGTALSFAADEYKVVAVRFSDKSDRDMLTEYVRALPDTAVTVYIASLMRERAFANEEWDTLIAEKPNATFVLH